MHTSSSEPIARPSRRDRALRKPIYCDHHAGSTSGGCPSHRKADAVRRERRNPPRTLQDRTHTSLSFCHCTASCLVGGDATGKAISPTVNPRCGIIRRCCSSATARAASSALHRLEADLRRHNLSRGTSRTLGASCVLSIATECK